MPRGRKPTGERTLTGAERQARYRQRQVGNRAVPPPRPSRPIQRSNRVQQWHAAVATLVALQAEYAVWLDALPEALRDGATVGLQPAGLTRGERCRQSSISISTSWSASSHRAALAEIDGYRPHPLHSQLDPKTVLVTSPPTTRWETPPRPPSDRNGGRFQIGMGGRFQSEYPAGFIGIRTSAGCKANIAHAKELMAAPMPEVDPPGAPAAADPDATTDHRPPCPCCGGRMIIVEVVGRGGAPRGPPSAGAGIKT